MKRNTTIAATLICCLALVSIVTSGLAAEEKKTPDIIAVGSGPVGGGFNMVTMGINKYWEKDLGITAQVVPGTVKDNLIRFISGRLDVLLSASGWYQAAWKADEKYGFKEPAKELRIMFNIYSNPFYLIALKKSGLKNVADLKGKRVGCGPAQDTWEKLIGDKFEANGLKFFGDKPDFTKIYANFQDMARMLGDGTLDACVSMVEGLTPQPPAQQLMQERELVALEWAPGVVEKFKGTYFGPALIKKEVLPFLTKDHLCFEGGMAAMCAAAKVDAELVYRLTKSMHKNLKQLAEENPYWKYPVVFPDVLMVDNGVPFHPGAIKYWQEAGIWKK